MASNLLYGRSAEVEKWVSERIPDCERGFGECQAVGVLRQGELIAGVVFHNWNPETRVIEISAASVDPRWASRTNLTDLFSYPFHSLQCRVAVSRTHENNRRVRKLWLAFGATEHLLPNLRGDGEAECVSLLTAQAWQESRLNNGQTQSTRPA